MEPSEQKQASLPSEEERDIMKSDETYKAFDYANYFVSYAYLYHQKQMLTDRVRMNSYHDAIKLNADVFKDKVVLDVGAGSGILSLWAAQAGASKVYAIEFTNMATHARNLVQSNGLEDVVEVIQSSVEELELPVEKVDIIVSEWMGYFLLRESMVDSLLFARDKFLKSRAKGDEEDGFLFPSHCTMFWAAISDEDERFERNREYNDSIVEWQEFQEDMSQYYGVEVSALSEQFAVEQKQYFIETAVWMELKTQHVLGVPQIVKVLDLNTCSWEDAKHVLETTFSITVSSPAYMSGFAGWFTCDFKGNPSVELEHPVMLSTGPEVGYTHWGQQACYLERPIDISSTQTIRGTFKMLRQAQNKRLYDIYFDFDLFVGQPPSSEEEEGDRTERQEKKGREVGGSYKYELP
jgi:protein arginine N-methyltransferase 1